MTFKDVKNEPEDLHSSSECEKSYSTKSSQRDEQTQLPKENHDNLLFSEF
jgi:hypothetical protein